jgi:LPXTG-site transpeptidase (sortase) family protein
MAEQASQPPKDLTLAPGVAGAAAGGEPVATGQRPAASAPAASGAEAPAPRPRRRWARIISNLMLLAGVAGILGLVAYFGITCAYTKVVQGNLREELETQNPQLAAAEATIDEGQFTSMESLATVPVTSIGSSTATTKALTPEEQAALEAELARQAELDAFRQAAQEFSMTVKGGQPIGKIVIPSIGLDVVMIEGVGTRQLKEGPGHWPETPFPGQSANFVVSGHRTTWGAPFFKLNEVEVGDEIFLVLPYVIAKYVVTRVVIVYPDEVEEVAQLGREQVSLAACHPIYSARQRIVVQGDLTSFALVDRKAQ